MTALVMAWKWDTGASSIQDFVVDKDGGLAVLVKEVAAALSVIDGGKSFYDGIIGDLQGELLRLRQENKTLNDSLDFWLARDGKPIGALSA